MNIYIILIIIGILLILIASFGLLRSGRIAPTSPIEKAKATISINIVNKRPIVDLKIEVKGDDVTLETNGLPFDGQYLIRDILNIQSMSGDKIPMNTNPSDPKFDFNEQMNPKKGEVLEYKIDLLAYYKNLNLAKDGVYKIKYSVDHKYPYGFYDKKKGIFGDGTVTYYLESNEVILKKAGDTFSIKGN